MLEVKELEPVTLHCVAHGSPQPHVTWKLRGRDLSQGQGLMQVNPAAGWCEGQVAVWERGCRTELAKAGGGGGFPLVS